MRCPRCDADDNKTQWTRQLWSHTARGVLCKGCGITFETHERPVTWPVPSILIEAPATDVPPDLTNEDFATDEG